VWRTRWFANDASRGLVLMLVWFGALIYPDTFIFGTGALLKVIDPEWAEYLASLTGFANGNDAGMTALHFERAESTVAALTLFGVGVLFVNLIRDGMRWLPRIGLLIAFLLMTIGVETLAHAFLFDEIPGWPLLTEGAREGIGIAVIALILATLLPARARWALGLAALLGALALINVYPDNPYVNTVGLSWTRGKLMNFYGLASGVNLVWPYLAIAYLLRHRQSPPNEQRRRTPLVKGSTVVTPL
jgi:hypothetical protein